MSIEKHDIHHEFPEYYDEIHTLKMNDNHFARLFKEYHDVDHQVKRIEQGVENTADEYVEQLKKQRLSLKDQLFSIIKQSQATA